MKKTWHCIILMIILFTELNCSAQEDIDLSLIKSPIIFKGDYKFGFRDPAVLFHNGVFHLFFTLVESAEDGGNYWYTAHSQSRNLVNWSFPVIITPKSRRLNFSSPGNIIKYNDEWILCLQTYPTPNREEFGTGDCRLYIMRSPDLYKWSEPELLKVKGNNIPVEDMGRMIDPYLIADSEQPGRWWCFYKQNGVSMSYSYDMKNWTYYGNAKSGENVSIIEVKNEFVLFHSPRNGIGIKRSSRINEWNENTKLIFLGQDEWDWAQGRITAGTVADLTDNNNIGKYFLFYHGESTEGREYSRAHGFASIGIAWSDDLKTWNWPQKNHNKK